MVVGWLGIPHETKVTRVTKVTMETKITKEAWGFPTQSLTHADTNVGLLIRSPLLLFNFNHNWNVSQISLKLLNIQFHDNPFYFSRVVTGRYGEANDSSSVHI
jgi:hypothetical protein